MATVANKQKMIIEDVVMRIKRGEWPPGMDLPLNKDLQIIYGAGRATIYAAKKRLEAMGLIDPGAGRGRRAMTSRHTTVSLNAPYLI